VLEGRPQPQLPRGRLSPATQIEDHTTARVVRHESARQSPPRATHSTRHRGGTPTRPRARRQPERKEGRQHRASSCSFPCGVSAAPGTSTSTSPKHSPSTSRSSGSPTSTPTTRGPSTPTCMRTPTLPSRPT
jgi:hypothetical protein